MSHVNEVAKSNDYATENVKELSEIEESDIDVAKIVKEYYKNAPEKIKKEMVKSFQKDVAEGMEKDEKFKSFVEDEETSPEITEDAIKDVDTATFELALEKSPNIPRTYRDGLMRVKNSFIDKQ
jgi:hypothetical protein